MRFTRLNRGDIMALGFNSNLFNTNTQARSTETAGVIASNNNVETAGTIATETAGTIAMAQGSMIDSFESSNPFAPQIDYSQFASFPETAGSIACETAGSIAFGDVETAGSIACETAGSVASTDCGSSFGSFDSGFVC